VDALMAWGVVAKKIWSVRMRGFRRGVVHGRIWESVYEFVESAWEAIWGSDTQGGDQWEWWWVIGRKK
jgi:hypothetical protein